MSKRWVKSDDPATQALFDEAQRDAEAAIERAGASYERQLLAYKADAKGGRRPVAAEVQSSRRKRR